MHLCCPATLHEVFKITIKGVLGQIRSDILNDWWVQFQVGLVRSSAIYCASKTAINRLTTND
jgi:hypothetical protein